jgi:hypothetical protein
LPDNSLLILFPGGIQAVLVQQHLAVLGPHLPRLPGNLCIDSVSEIGIEGGLIETREFLV